MTYVHALVSRARFFWLHDYSAKVPGGVLTTCGKRLVYWKTCETIARGATALCPRCFPKQVRVIEETEFPQQPQAGDMLKGFDGYWWLYDGSDWRGPYPRQEKAANDYIRKKEYLRENKKQRQTPR